MENDDIDPRDLLDREQRLNYFEYVAGLIGDELMPDYKPADGPKKSPIKEPGLLDAKDARGGVPGLLKGVAVGAIKRTLGDNNEVSATENPRSAIVEVDDAGAGILAGFVKPKGPQGSFDAQTPAVQRQILRQLRRDPVLRGQVARAVGGPEFLAAKGIPLPLPETVSSVASIVAGGVAPKKAGGGIPVVQPLVNVAVDAVLGAILNIDGFFAANPADP